MNPWPITSPQQATLTGNVAGATTSVKAFGSNTTTGNFLAIVFQTQNGGAVTVADNVNGSWSNALTNIQSNNGNYNIFYKENVTGGATTVTVTCPSSDYITGVIYEFNGVTTSGSFYEAMNNQSQLTSGTNIAVLPSGNPWNATSTSSELVIVGMFHNNSSTTVAVDNPNGYSGFVNQLGSYQTGFSGGVTASAWYNSTNGTQPTLNFAFDASSSGADYTNNVMAIFSAQGSTLFVPQPALGTLGVG